MLSKVEKTQENIVRCLCLSCPSYSSVCRLKNAHLNTNTPKKRLEEKTHYEKMFCAFEKSNCIHLNKGCICQKCLNYRQYGLKNCDYCTHTGGTDSCRNYL